MSRIATPTRAAPVLTEAELYQRHNSVQRRDAEEALAEWAARGRARPGARVLDVGCGDGGVTAQLLRRHLPAAHSLLGCDIAPEMVRHADKHHGDSTTAFVVQDISAPAPPFLRQFDHVFSFYVLHWVQDQERALSNIYAALVPGGDCLLVLLGHIAMYDFYRELAARPTWAHLMRDLDSFVSPYHDRADPQRDLTDLLRRVGFAQVHVQYKEKFYHFEGLDNFKKAVRAVNPFNHRLSEAQQELFQEDYLDILRRRGLLRGTDSAATVRYRYRLLVAHAVK